MNFNIGDKVIVFGHMAGKVIQLNTPAPGWTEVEVDSLKFRIITGYFKDSDLTLEIESNDNKN